MIKFKDYSWALDGLAALLLLVGFIFMTMDVVGGENQMASIVIRLTGLGILFFTIIRIKPIISSRNEKDYILVMFSEIIVDITAGVLMLFFTENVTNNKIFNFGNLGGAVLYIRGITHFWTTSKRYELHDIISFIVNIAFISFGFLFLWTEILNESNVVVAIMVLAALLTMYFSYRSYRGYHNYRITKVNALKVNDYLSKNKGKEKEINKDKVIEDPKTIEDQIHPKKIEEPKDDNRPTIDIN